MTHSLFQKDDIIDIISMNPSGFWKGVCHGKVGIFKFINVVIIPDRAGERSRKNSRGRSINRGSKPRSVHELLRRIGLEEHIAVFVLNGYDNLKMVQELDERELDYLGIVDVEQRAKILTAVELLLDYESKLFGVKVIGTT